MNEERSFALAYILGTILKDILLDTATPTMNIVEAAKLLNPNEFPESIRHLISHLKGYEVWDDETRTYFLQEFFEMRSEFINLPKVEWWNNDRSSKTNNS